MSGDADGVLNFDEDLSFPAPSSPSSGPARDGGDRTPDIWGVVYMSGSPERIVSNFRWSFKDINTNLEEPTVRI